MPFIKYADKSSRIGRKSLTQPERLQFPRRRTSRETNTCAFHRRVKGRRNHAQKRTDRLVFSHFMSLF